MPEHKNGRRFAQRAMVNGCGQKVNARGGKSMKRGRGGGRAVGTGKSHEHGTLD